MSDAQQSETKVTTQQLGKRVGELEVDVKNLTKSVGDLSTVAASTQQQVNMLTQGQTAQSEKLDRLLARTAGGEATKGMIPVSYVTWGIGAFLTLAGLGLSITTIGGAVVLFAVNSGDKQSSAKIESISKLERAHIDHVNETIDLRVATVEDEINENTANVERIDHEYLPTTQFDRFIDTEFLPLRDRMTEAEVKEARNDERIQKTWEEIVDHEDELDHPIRQTYELEGLKKLLDEQRSHDHESAGNE